MRRKRQKVSSSESSSSSGEKSRARLLFMGDHGGSLASIKVKQGQQFEAGDVLARCVCNLAESSNKPLLDLLAPYDGTVLEWFYQEKQPVPPKADAPDQQAVVRISYCRHDIILPGYGLCGVCGRAPSQMDAPEKSRFETEADTVGESGAQKVDVRDATSANMTVNIGGGAKILVSRNEAEDERKVTVSRLFGKQKLLLVLDIDHTMLHATDDARAPAFAASKGLSKELHTFFLPASEEYKTPEKPHYVMLRPGLCKWLAELSKMYELYIYTAGTRVYAEAVTKIFDPSGELFGTRIISRTDVPELGKVKRLERFFPVDNNMVLAVDDRSDVWREDGSNLITIRPYHFFHGMADINNSSGPEFDLKGEMEMEAKDEKHRDRFDHGLKRTLELLRWIHGKFYEKKISTQEQLDGKGQDVKVLVRKLRSRILRNQPLVIDAPVDTLQYRAIQGLAEAGGGRCLPAIDPSVQDLIVVSENPRSELSERAYKQKLWVVHPDWLHACIHNWNKEPYQHYCIFGVRADASPRKASSSSSSSSSSPSSSSPNSPTSSTAPSQQQPAKAVKYDAFGYPIDDNEDEDTNPEESGEKEDDDDDDEEEEEGEAGLQGFMDSL